MKSKATVALVCSALILLALVFVVAQGAPAPQDRAATTQPATPVAADALAKREELSKPGAEHLRLHPFVGLWRVKVKIWLAPDSEPIESEAHSQGKWIMASRFINTRYTGELNGKVFTGIGYLGYDNIKKKYVSVWLGSNGTGITTAEGTWDDLDRTLTMDSEYTDPATGKTVRVMTKTRITSRTQYVREVFITGPDGKPFKSKELIFSKQK